MSLPDQYSSDKTRLRPLPRCRRPQRWTHGHAANYLIVDDDTVCAILLVEVTYRCTRVFEASAVFDTGAKGPTAAKADAPDLVLMMYGFAIPMVREVVAQPAHKVASAPIIISPTRY